MGVWFGCYEVSCRKISCWIILFLLRIFDRIVSRAMWQINLWRDTNELLIITTIKTHRYEIPTKHCEVGTVGTSWETLVNEIPISPGLVEPREGPSSEMMPQHWIKHLHNRGISNKYLCDVCDCAVILSTVPSKWPYLSMISYYNHVVSPLLIAGCVWDTCYIV